MTIRQKCSNQTSLVEKFGALLLKAGAELSLGFCRMGGFVKKKILEADTLSKDGLIKNRPGLSVF